MSGLKAKAYGREGRVAIFRGSQWDTKLVSSEGFEPSTYRLKVRCSTS
jgi:hypothetical protein